MLVTALRGVVQRVSRTKFRHMHSSQQLHRQSSRTQNSKSGLHLWKPRTSNWKKNSNKLEPKHLQMLLSVQATRSWSSSRRALKIRNHKSFSCPQTRKSFKTMSSSLCKPRSPNTKLHSRLSSPSWTIRKRLSKTSTRSETRILSSRSGNSVLSCQHFMKWDFRCSATLLSSPRIRALGLPKPVSKFRPCNVSSPLRQPYVLPLRLCDSGDGGRDDGGNDGWPPMTRHLLSRSLCMFVFFRCLAIVLTRVSRSYRIRAGRGRTLVGSQLVMRRLKPVIRSWIFFQL
mmetsp:Transcript_2203/g.5074  ORF Transcript_2203/g.5074 Transcript_2203/m.5074 type:complete len:286 (-) Transcript_2203:179-1036(-)